MRSRLSFSSRSLGTRRHKAPNSETETYRYATYMYICMHDVIWRIKGARCTTLSDQVREPNNAVRIYSSFLHANIVYINVFQA